MKEPSESSLAWLVFTTICALIGFIVLVVLLLSILGVLFAYHWTTLAVVGLIVLSIAASMTLVRRRKTRKSRIQ